MAGHSHAANVARRKGAVDAKRAKIFSKCAREIMSAVRQGGPDIDTNLKLKYAVEKAKAANMPKDNIERAIKSASGDKGGDEFEHLTYEGYAPGGVAVMVACLTDKRTRTAPEVRNVFEKRGGNMGTPGSVSFMFDHKSVFVVECGDKDEDALMEIAIEAGADDVQVDGELATIYAEATDFLSVKEGLEGAELTFVSAETGYVPQNTIAVASKDDAKKIMRLISELEDNDDVQNVYANFDIPSEWFDELAD